MSNHIPMCPVCNENEVGSFFGSEFFCSEVCEDIAQEEAKEYYDALLAKQYEDGEPEGSYDLSDDGDALASAGFGTDEDYGYFGDDC